MKPIFFALTVLASGFVTKADAATFEVSFDGVVDKIVLNYPAYDNAVTFGGIRSFYFLRNLGPLLDDMFYEASFTINTSAVGFPLSSNPNVTEYYQTTPTPVVSDLTFVFDQYIEMSLPQNGYARVTNTPSTGADADDVDGIEINTFAARDDFFEGYRMRKATVSLSSMDKTILNSGALPSIPQWGALFEDSQTRNISSIFLEYSRDGPTEALYPFPLRIDLYITSYSYEIIEVAAPIPLPAGAPLLLAGLGVIAALRRKAAAP